MAWTMALPMYNLTPALRDGYEALAGELVDVFRAEGLRGAVALLRDPVLPEVWKRPDLLLSQSCGYPYITQLREQVQLVAVPAYDFPGCQGGAYSSAILVRSDSGMRTLADARGKTAAVNERHSNSGMNALRHAIAPLAVEGRFFGSVNWSGSHRASIAQLRNGDADIAAIDCVTLGYLRRYDSTCLDGVCVLGQSASSPGLPFIAGAAVPPALLQALQRALFNPPTTLAAILDALSIRTFVAYGPGDYARIGALEQQAISNGYPDVA